MWCKILLLTFLQIILLDAHPVGSSGSSAMWSVHLPELSEAPSSHDLLKFFQYLNKDSPQIYGQANKRAFTILSRWRPFTNLGKNTQSIREQNRQYYNDLDIETRAMLRPIGQPLRWG